MRAQYIVSLKRLPKPNSQNLPLRRSRDVEVKGCILDTIYVTCLSQRIKKTKSSFEEEEEKNVESDFIFMAFHCWSIST